jgi:vancomycin resistance protein YoaR
VNRWLRALGWVLPMLIGVGAGAWLSVTDYAFEGRVLPRVMVGASAVGGLTVPELGARIRTVAQPEMDRSVVLRAHGMSGTVSAQALGLRVDVERTIVLAMNAGRRGGSLRRLRDRIVMLGRPERVPVVFAYDAAAARAASRTFMAPVLAEPRDVQVDVVAGRLVVKQPSQDGVVVHEPTSTMRVIDALAHRQPAADLAIELRRPVFTTEMADRMAEPVARFTTRFSYYPDRIHNIRLAAGSLKGRLLAPGAVLSYNEVVGPRTPSRGYRKAPVIINNELVPGDGGGVCQVSSTLFNAAVLADMAIESRVSHSRPVAYVTAGRDATVEYGSIDLRVRNTTGQYLLVWTEVGPRSLTISVFGRRPPGREISVALVNQVVIPAPAHTVTRRDPGLPAGQTKVEPAHTGLRSRTLRIVKQDGVIIREELIGRNYYHPTPRIVKVGTAKVSLQTADQVVNP